MEKTVSKYLKDYNMKRDEVENIIQLSHDLNLILGNREDLDDLKIKHLSGFQPGFGTYHIYYVTGNSVLAMKRILRQGLGIIKLIRE